MGWVWLFWEYNYNGLKCRVIRKMRNQCASVHPYLLYCIHYYLNKKIVYAEKTESHANMNSEFCLDVREWYGFLTMWRWMSLVQLSIRPTLIRSLLIVSNVTADVILPAASLDAHLFLLLLEPHGWCRIWCFISESETQISLTGGHPSASTIPAYRGPPLFLSTVCNTS